MSLWCRAAWSTSCWRDPRRGDDVGARRTDLSTSAARSAARSYDPHAVEACWQARWEADRLDHAPEFDPRPKQYVLTMFPYPSGERLHVGRWFAYIPADARARYLRMRGHNVLFPIGSDAFGLPAENAAIRRGIHPYRWTMENIVEMRRQFRSMGAMWDWDREIITCDPAYYRWNQWFFLKMYERGLAYRAVGPVDWCPRCNTSLAREQVVGAGRLCERCDTPVVKRTLEQWFLRITAYAEELLDFSGIDWPERIRTLQENWIGRSEGVEFSMAVAGHPDVSLRVFTTRADTVYGMTFAVLAPEHPLVDLITTADRKEQVEAYRYKAARASDIERLSTEKERDGVFTGASSVNPVNGAPVPIYVADYVLLSYGTGAVMGVPAHDQRDYEFAVKYGLPHPVVVAPPGWDGAPLPEAYLGAGTMVNSGPFDGLPSGEGWERIADELERRSIGRRTVTYRLHDWLISRQRYWGTPIPIIYCKTCGTVPVPQEDLPVVLPHDAEFRPTGESPLRYHEAFRKVRCPRCGGEEAERETDTMDTFVDSSWYQYRYLSPHDAERPFDPAAGRYWLPVDQYTGGIEHAVLHLLYVRFWTKVMRDLGLVDFDEPIRRFYANGLITAPGGERLSTSRGTLVVADELVRAHGTDAVRAHLMFFVPWDQGGSWSDRGIAGITRFLHRVWSLVVDPGPAQPGGPGDPAALRRRTHRVIRQVTDDVEHFRFNTALAVLMEFCRGLQRAGRTAVRGGPEWREAIRSLLLLLAPFVPHLAEELWAAIGGFYSIHRQPWPSYDPELAQVQTVTLVVQVNGRVRDRIQVPHDIGETEVRRVALESPRVQQVLAGRQVAKVIVVPGRLVNLVVG